MQSSNRVTTQSCYLHSGGHISIKSSGHISIKTKYSNTIGAGVTEALIVNPFEVVKVNLQSDAMFDADIFREFFFKKFVHIRAFWVQWHCINKLPARKSKIVEKKTPKVYSLQKSKFFTLQNN